MDNLTEAKLEMPQEVLGCGGVIGEIMSHTLDQSHSPNPALAFTGALAFVSHLIGRRFRTGSNGRPNLYLMAHGWSGVGKDSPRKTNYALAKECGLLKTVADDFRSGEAIQDELLTRAKLLCQYDEVDALFETLKAKRDAVAANMLGTMLTVWSKSSSFMPRRKLANSRVSKKDDATPDLVFHPHFTLFATGITSEIFKAVSEKLAMNGFFARLLVINAGKRGTPKDVVYAPPPSDLVAKCRVLCGYTTDAKSWNELNPAWDGTGLIVPSAADALTAKAEILQWQEAHYNSDEDGPSNAVWVRSAEKCERLALCFACSDDPHAPIIKERHYQLAKALVEYSNLSQLSLLGKYAASTEYEDLLKKILRKLARGRYCNRELLKNLHIKSSELQEACETLRNSGEIIFCDNTGKEVPLWSPTVSYELA